MTPEQQSTFLDHVVALEPKRTDEDRMVYTIKLIAYVNSLLAQARAGGMKDALVAASDIFSGERAYNFVMADGYANSADIAGELLFMSTQVDAIRAQGQGQGCGNG